MICVLTTTLVPSVYTDFVGGLSSRELPQGYLENPIEDEVDYSSLSKNEELLDYDWSPPNGELPDSNYNSVESLSAYFENGDSHRVGERWLDKSGELVEKEPKTDLKRALGISRDKRSQVLCRVQKAIHHHSEAGYEFFPKSYTSYSCHPVAPSQFEGSLSTSHDTCFITGNNCITIEKEQLFLKRRQNTKCWTHFIEAVGAGCKCLPKKYYI